MEKNHNKILSIALFAISGFCFYKHLNFLAAVNVFAGLGFFINGFIDLFYKNYDNNPRAYHKLRKVGLFMGYLGLFIIFLFIFIYPIFKKPAL